MSDKVRKPGQTYISDNVKIQYHSSLTNEEGEKLIGKTIMKVEAWEFGIKLIFTDGSILMARGFTMEQKVISSLNVDFSETIIDID